MNDLIEMGISGVGGGQSGNPSGLLARRAAYLSKVNVDEIAGLLPTRRSLYSTRNIPAAAVALNAEFQFGHKGIGDGQATLGWSGLPNDVLGAEQTNFLQDGTLAIGELFAVYGFSIEFPDNVAMADLRAMRNWSVRWTEGQGTETVELGQVAEMPRVFGIELEFGYGADDESQVDRNPRLVGAPYRHDKPMFIVRGLSSRADQGHVVLRCNKAVTISAATAVTVRYHGVYYQRVRGAVSGT